MTQVISLTPTMTKRMGFEHELFDSLNVDSTPVGFDKIEKLAQTLSRDDLILASLYLVKDMVSRYRAHFPETRRMTDDLVSVGLEALTEFCDQMKNADEYRNKLNRFLNHRMRDYINDNRSMFSASRATNERRLQSGEPLEYNFATQYSDELNGEDDYSPNYVDLLDEVEALAETDREHMYHLIMLALNKNHNIDEASLTDEERAAIDRLSEIGAGL